MFWIHTYKYNNSRGRMLSKSVPSIVAVAWYGLS